MILGYKYPVIISKLGLFGKPKTEAQKLYLQACFAHILTVYFNLLLLP